MLYSSANAIDNNDTQAPTVNNINSLVSGHTYNTPTYSFFMNSVSVTDSKNAGSYKVVAGVVIMNGEEDVTDNYNITNSSYEYVINKATPTYTLPIRTTSACEILSILGNQFCAV